MTNTYTIHVTGNVHGDLNVAGRDITTWAAAREAGISPEQVKPPIFVSYASADRATIVAPLVERLEGAGYTVWYDQHNLTGGDDWKREIDEGIRRCVAFVPVLTPRSIDESKHQWAVYEQRQALKLFAPVVPAYAEACDVPDYFRHLQYVDITTLDDASFGRLAAAIEKKLHRRGAQLIDQTPPEGRAFIGRQAELEHVVGMLSSETVAIAAVQGMGGLGKTMLVGEIARRLHHRYPGGVIFERRGQSPPSLQVVLQRWAGYVLGERPLEEMRPADVRGLLEGRGELLVILDDIWPEDFAAAQTLLSALPEDAERLITTRFDEGATAIGAKVYPLQRMSEADGVALLRDRLRQRPGPDPDEALLKRLQAAVGGHALALELAAGRVRDTNRIQGQIERLEERIKQGDLSRIAAKVPGLGKDASLGASLDLSFDVVADARPDLAALLPPLAVFAENESFTHEAAAAVWDMDPVDTEDALDDLIGWGLVRAEEGRFTQHMLVRAYEWGQLNADPAAREAALGRYADHYFAIARAVKDDWRKTDEEAAHILEAAERVCDTLGIDLIKQYSQPKPSTELSSMPPTAQAVLEMALAISYYVHDRRIYEGIRWLRAGLTVARLLDEREHESLMLGFIGSWHDHRGQWQRALAYYQRALPITRDLRDQFGEAATLNSIGMVYHILGDHRQALAYVQQALPIIREVEDRFGEAATLNNIASIYDEIGKHQQALRYFKEALDIIREMGDRTGEATTLNNIGLVYGRLGDNHQALYYYQLALPIHRDVGNWTMEAVTCYNIAVSYEAEGNFEHAIKYMIRCVELDEQVQHPDLESDRVYLARLRAKHGG